MIGSTTEKIKLLIFLVSFAYPNSHIFVRQKKSVTILVCVTILRLYTVNLIIYMTIIYMTKFIPKTSRSSTDCEIKFPLCLNQSKMSVSIELHNEK